MFMLRRAGVSAQALVFYLRHSGVLVDYRDEFDFGLAEEPRLGIGTLREFAAVWYSGGSGPCCACAGSGRRRLSVRVSAQAE
jgi:hypothetical protein